MLLLGWALQTPVCVCLSGFIIAACEMPCTLQYISRPVHLFPIPVLGMKKASRLMDFHHFGVANLLFLKALWRKLFLRMRSEKKNRDLLETETERELIPIWRALLSTDAQQMCV